MKLNEIVRAEPEINVTLTIKDIKILRYIIGIRYYNSPRGIHFDFNDEEKLFNIIADIDDQVSG